MRIFIFAAALMSSRLAAAAPRQAAAAGVLDSADTVRGQTGLASSATAADCYGKAGHKCDKNSDCCEPMVCGSGKECGGCKALNVDCQNNGQCCSKVCGSGYKCSSCNGEGGNCDKNGDCCDPLVCGTAKQCSTCNGVGGACYNEDGTSDTDPYGPNQCCSGLICDYHYGTPFSSNEGKCKTPD
jgi:hypothetical protein